MLISGAFGYMADYLLLWLVLFSLIVHSWCFFKFFPWRRRKRTGLVIGNALVLACLLGFAAMAGESYFRFVCVETDTFGVSVPARRWFAVHTKLNSLGCRDVEWTKEKPEGLRRIAFLGDSFTYGWGIERVEDRFTDRLQARFDGLSAGAVEVMNVAKPGWGSRAEFQAMRDMIAQYGVNEVVLCYVPNDIERLLPTWSDFNPIRPPEPRFFNSDSSCLLDYLYRRIVLPRVPAVRNYHDWLAEGYADESIWRLHERQLNDMIQHCKERNVAFRVLILPFLRTTGKKFEPVGLHAVVKRFFEVNRTDVLDLLPVIANLDPSELVVNRRDPHPNEQAHELFARAIWASFYESDGTRPLGRGSD